MSLFRHFTVWFIVVLSLASTPLYGESSSGVAGRGSDTARYYWRDLNIGGTAEICTLFWRKSQNEGGISATRARPADIPVIAVLRDTLGDANPENDRLTYVWLLTYERPSVDQRLLSAIPFFYWHPDEGPSSDHQRDTRPLLNLAEPEHATVAEFRRDLMQWAALDPSTVPIRAVSRTFRTNEVDEERLHLEESVSYLRQSPASTGEEGLTRKQIETVVARLELRKKLLGGLVSERQAARLGRHTSFQQEETRIRNWEQLRQCADKTGLVFQPLNVGATSGEYAMLSFPLGEPALKSGTSLKPVWKLLDIRDPWRNSRVQATYQRACTSARNLCGGESRLVPLAVYSLNYSRAPLLLVDFSNTEHLRLREMTQRSINEVTAGVLGISHFTNWYYFVAADIYNFYAGRHGAAMNQSARRDCYSQFRVELSIDTHLDPELRAELRQRMEALAINPLESNPSREIASAQKRYAQLQEEARPNGPLEARIENDRRHELVLDTETGKHIAFDQMIHELTFGAYTHRAKPAPQDLEALDRYRRIQYQLAFLDSLVNSGTPPEVSYESARIRNSVAEVSALISDVPSPVMRARATATFERLRELSLDTDLRADCSQAMASIRQPYPDTAASGGGDALGMSFEMSKSKMLHTQ
ncbi:MAG: hypothetical protein JO319_05485 [Acidobacteriaceae bacterium]|nr:hypothetical protein [Acidobacteriaceae bacterium]